MRYKLWKFYENRARNAPLLGVYIPHYDKISVKNFCGSYTLIVGQMGVKVSMEASVQDFTPPVQRVAPTGQKTSKSASE